MPSVPAAASARRAPGSVAQNNSWRSGSGGGGAMSTTPRRPPTSMWYHELENPDEAFVLPFYRYVAQLNRQTTGREWFQVNGIGGGSGISARSVKSMDAKMSAPHYCSSAQGRCGSATRKTVPAAEAVMENSIYVRSVPVRIPDTVVFMRRMPRAWFTYDEDAHVVLRLPPLSLDTVKIFDHFSAVLPNSDGICALFFSTDEHGQLVVQPLRPPELEAFLGGRPSILDRCPDGALQKYVPVAGRSNGVIEVLWSPSSCGVYPAQIPSVKDIPPSAIRSSDESVGLTVAALHDQVFGQMGWFLPDLLRFERRRIIRFSALFRVDTESRVWLIGSTCVRCAPAGEPFNVTVAIPRMPMGLLRPAPFRAPRLDLTTPTLTVGKPPPARPPNLPRTATSELIPFFFTPLHLSKPFSAGSSAIDVASKALPRDLLFSALEVESDLIHYARETNAFLGCEVSPPPIAAVVASAAAQSARRSSGGSHSGSLRDGSEEACRIAPARGPSLRFSRRGFGSGGTSSFHHSKDVRRKGPADSQKDAPVETEAQRKRSQFLAQLQARVQALAAFSRNTGELVTATLLDALSGGLSLSMPAAEWKTFVGNIVMYLDSAAWEGEALKTDAERDAIVKMLVKSAVGAKVEMLPDLEQKRKLTEEKAARVLLLQKQSRAQHQRRYGQDDGGAAEADEDPSQLRTARQLTAFDDVGPPTFSFEHLEQPNVALLMSSSAVITSTALKIKSGLMGRHGKRTITSEATEWLWRLQRDFEEWSQRVIADLEATEKRQFEEELAHDSNVADASSASVSFTASRAKDAQALLGESVSVGTAGWGASTTAAAAELEEESSTHVALSALAAAAAVEAENEAQMTEGSSRNDEEDEEGRETEASASEADMREASQNDYHDEFDDEDETGAAPKQEHAGAADEYRKEGAKASMSPPRLQPPVLSGKQRTVSISPVPQLPSPRLPRPPSGARLQQPTRTKK